MNTYKNTSESWIPPFCPNPKCFHHNDPGDSWPVKRIGNFRRQNPPFCVQRFLCKACKKSFSTQTFEQSYWQKRPDLDAKIIMKTVGGMANRQIARDLKVSPETINRHIARLGRHCLLFHKEQMRNAPPVKVVVVDGFESFELSQYHPIHHHVAVEKETDFFVYFTDSELRRKGRMTAPQKKRRQELELLLGRPDPKAIEKDMLELLEVSLGDQHGALVHSDAHPAYLRSIKRLNVNVDHQVTPGSHHRDSRNSLWEVNLLDRIIRHCNANHRRETIAWSKRRQASAERLAILLVWRNYMKGRREKERGSPTPAMERGMMGDPLEIEVLLEKRLFKSRIDLPPRWSQYYNRTVRTRGIERERHHELKYAY